MKKSTIFQVFVVAFCCLMSTKIQAQNSGIFSSYVIVDEDNTGNSFYKLLNNSDSSTPNFQNKLFLIFSNSESLVLKGFENKTFQTNGDEVQDVKLHYRVYLQDDPSPPAFNEISLNVNGPNDSYIGGNDTLWLINNQNIDIIQGLPNGFYIFEVFSSAYITYPGGSYTYYVSNFGNNFKANIRVERGMTWYADTDGDGYGDPNNTTFSVNQPNGYVLDNTDCDDTNANVNPGAVELPCDGIDNNCNGGIDENRKDADGDGYDECVDCDDFNAAINPGAIELPCDNIDNNCDGNIDETRVDADGDGFDECVDCNDNDATINPGAIDIPCDGIDNNCDGNIDETVVDADGDGVTQCFDCDDTNS
ncbi:putative metal-binding motif-containing protein, partial [Olleya aquimaris]